MKHFHHKELSMNWSFHLSTVRFGAHPTRRDQAGARSMTRRVIVVSLFASLSYVASTASANEALTTKHACAACHQAERKVVGPSWKEIAGRYGGGGMSPTQLAASIKAGSTGKWGAIPMPAQAQVPEADLQTLAAWILDRSK
jgi:cytochrome c